MENDIYDRYTPCLIGIVVDLLQSKDITKCMINVIQSIEGDDKFYVGGTGELHSSKGKMIASVANFKRKYDFDIGVTLRDVFSKFAKEHQDSKKVVFVFTDCYSKKCKHTFKNALLVNDRKEMGNKVFVYGVGDKYDRDIEKLCAEFSNCHFEHLDVFPNNVDSLIIKSYGVL